MIITHIVSIQFYVIKPKPYLLSIVHTDSYVYNIFVYLEWFSLYQLVPKAKDMFTVSWKVYHTIDPGVVLKREIKTLSQNE